MDDDVRDFVLVVHVWFLAAGGYLPIVGACLRFAPDVPNPTYVVRWWLVLLFVVWCAGCCVDCSCCYLCVVVVVAVLC